MLSRPEPPDPVRASDRSPVNELVHDVGAPAANVPEFEVFVAPTNATKSLDPVVGVIDGVVTETAPENPALLPLDTSNAVMPEYSTICHVALNAPDIVSVGVSLELPDATSFSKR